LVIVIDISSLPVPLLQDPFHRTAWERAVKRAKLPDLHWHDLRHTFASWAVQRRVSLYEL